MAQPESYVGLPSGRLPRLPRPLAELLAALAVELPELLRLNLIGLDLYGSLTQRAFDARLSDVDGLVATRRNLSARELKRLGAWLDGLRGNPWIARLQLSFLRQATLLRQDPRACTLQEGRLWRSGSDGNPIVWRNVLDSGITLYGPPPASFLPPITTAMMHAALAREAAYLRDELGDARSRWRDKPYYRAYAVLTACRILYTHATGRVGAKPVAARWALRRLPERFHPLIRLALTSRHHDATALLLLREVRALVAYAARETGGR